MATKRISYIDMAKGIGIILVVLGHTPFLSESFSTWIYSFHMPLFFIISGVILSHTDASKYSFGTFVKKKAKTILIPYFTFSILTILLNAILDRATFSSEIQDALITTFCLNGLSVLWFLPALFFGEVLFLFIKKHTSYWGSILLTLLLCILTVLGVNTFHYHYETDFNSMLSVFGAYMVAVVVRAGIATFFVGFGYFIYGILFTKEYTRTMRLCLAVLLLFYNVIFAFKNGSVDLNYLLFHNYLLYFSVAISGSLSILLFCSVLPELKLLSAIGKESLIIMVTHMNCRYLGFCYAAGNLLLAVLPFIGQFGYVVFVLLCLALLESISIWTIHRFVPALIGSF